MLNCFLLILQTFQAGGGRRIRGTYLRWPGFVCRLHFGDLPWRRHKILSIYRISGILMNLNTKAGRSCYWWRKVRRHLSLSYIFHSMQDLKTKIKIRLLMSYCPMHCTVWAVFCLCVCIALWGCSCNSVEFLASQHCTIIWSADLSYSPCSLNFLCIWFLVTENRLGWTSLPSTKLCFYGTFCLFYTRKHIFLI